MLPDESPVAAEIAKEYAIELAAMSRLHKAVVGMMTVDSWTIRRTSGTKTLARRSLVTSQGDAGTIIREYTGLGVLDF